MDIALGDMLSAIPLDYVEKRGSWLLRGEEILRFMQEKEFGWEVLWTNEVAEKMEEINDLMLQIQQAYKDLLIIFLRSPTQLRLEFLAQGLISEIEE